MRKRAIVSKIALDSDILKLSDFEFRVFILTIANADNYGRFVADGEDFKAHADSRSKRNGDEYDKALKAIAEANLIKIYEVNGKHYLKLKEKSFDKINRVFVKEKGLPEFPDEIPIKDKEIEIMNEEQDLDEFMFINWGEVWNRFAYIIKKKIVDLKMKHGWKKFAQAVEYCADRDIRNYKYLQAILEPKNIEEKNESKKFVSAITYLRNKKNEKDRADKQD